MAELIALTTQPVTLTGNTNQNLWSAVEVPHCDMLDLQLGVVATTGSMTGTLSIRVLTGVQTLTDDNSWVVAQTRSGANVFADITLNGLTLPYWTSASVNMGFTRYLRWSLINWGLNGLSSVTFVVQGMARRYARRSGATATLGATASGGSALGIAPPPADAKFGAAVGTFIGGVSPFEMLQRPDASNRFLGGDQRDCECENASTKRYDAPAGRAVGR